MNYKLKSKMQNYKTSGKWKQSWGPRWLLSGAMKGKADTFCLTDSNAGGRPLLDMMLLALVYKGDLRDGRHQAGTRRTSSTRSTSRVNRHRLSSVRQ